MKRRDFMKQEFIGLDIEVVGSNHPAYKDIRGTVVNETKNTIVVENRGKELMVPKRGNTFQFTYEGEKIVVEGSEIQHRPEDRIKKIR
jgi:ribonuclease P protein subunit POP4